MLDWEEEEVGEEEEIRTRRRRGGGGGEGEGAGRRGRDKEEFLFGRRNAPNTLCSTYKTNILLIFQNGIDN